MHALIVPVLGIETPLIEETDEEALGGPSEIVAQMTVWTRWVNYVGVPAVSVPAGVDSNALPVGIQVIGRPYSELLLLSIAGLVERISSRGVDHQ